jgi:hypothetical protein
MYFFNWLIRTQDNLLMPDGTIKPTSASAMSVWRLILPRATLTRGVLRSMSNVVGYLPADFDVKRTRSTAMVSQDSMDVSSQVTFSNAQMSYKPHGVSYTATTVVEYPYQIKSAYFVLAADEVLTPVITNGDKQGCGSSSSSCEQTWAVQVDLDDNQCDFLLIGYFVSELECAVDNAQLCPHAGAQILSVVSLGVSSSKALCPQSLSGKSVVRVSF